MLAGVSGDDKALPSLQTQASRFLQEFLTQGEALVRDLIQENERLKGQADGESPAVRSVDVVVERLVRQIADLEHECHEIRTLAGSMREQSGGYQNRLDDLEREHYHLAAMYVAGNQFHAAATIDEVLRTTTEILLNFVGVGGFTLYAIDEEQQRAFPAVREGAELAECSELSLSDDSVLAALASPRGPWRNGGAMAASGGVLMHLPLVAGTRLVGVIRIESFLPQKNEFVDTDFSLLELISEHAGIGIETAWIRAHARDVPMQRQALESLVGG